MIMITAIFLLGLMSPARQGAQPAAPPTVVHDSLFSPALGVWKHVVVHLPASYQNASVRRYPVAYYLHGLTGSETNWTKNGRLDSTAAVLEASGGPELILVMPDGDDGWYLNWIATDSYDGCVAEKRAESASYCVQSANYADYVARDIVAFIDGKYRTKAAREHRGIAGLSMGGFGALKLALQYPTVFAAAASHSGVVSPLLNGLTRDDNPIYATKIDSSFMMNRGFRLSFLKALGADVAIWSANDPAALVRALHQSKTALPALYIDCGTEDNLITQNRALHRDLETLKVPHQYHEHPGAHTWSYWRQHSDESLAWLASIIGK